LEEGKSRNIVDQIRHLILAGYCTFHWVGWATFARLVRDTTLEVLDMDYIKVMRSFGAPNRYIAYKYALKNAIIPVVATIGLGVGKLLGGAVFVELIFNRPGIGKVITDAVFARDFACGTGRVSVAALLFILANLAADLSYAYFDSRGYGTNKGEINRNDSGKGLFETSRADGIVTRGNLIYGSKKIAQIIRAFSGGSLGG